MPNQHTNGPGPIAVVNKADILRRVSDGEYLATIADDLGITRQAISKSISSDTDYQDAREAGIERRLAQREMEMETADEQVSLARARELLSHQRWRAERECPARWGQRTQVDVQIDIGVALQQLSERLQQNVVTNVVTIDQVSDNSQSDQGDTQ